MLTESWTETPDRPKPSLGRIVLVPCDPAWNNGSDIAPAVVTRVWNDDVVNVRVLLDGVETVPARTSVTYVASLREVPDDDPGREYHWTWPPRV